MMHPRIKLAPALFLALAACGAGESKDVDEGDELRGNVASDQGFPGEIAADTTDIFWASDQESTAGIYKRARSGSGAAQRIAPASPNVGSLVLDASSVYWISEDGVIFSVSKRGGEPKKLGQVEPQRTTSLTLDETDAYVSTGGASIWKAPKSSDGATKLATGAFSALASDRENLYYVKQTKILTPAGPEYGVFRLPKGGSYPADEKPVGAVKNDEPLKLLVGDKQIFYSYRDGRNNRQVVLQVDKASGEEKELADTSLNRPHTAALSGDALCFANREAITCQRTSGGASVEATRGTAIQGLALQGTTLFWTERAESKGFFDQRRERLDTGAVHQGPLPRLR
jgi:hypothetical protein